MQFSSTSLWKPEITNTTVVIHNNKNCEGMQSGFFGRCGCEWCFVCHEVWSNVTVISKIIIKVMNVLFFYHETPCNFILIFISFQVFFWMFVTSTSNTKLKSYNFHATTFRAMGNLTILFQGVKMLSYRGRVVDCW